MLDLNLLQEEAFQYAIPPNISGRTVNCLDNLKFQTLQIITPNVWGFVQWPIRDPGSRAAKSRSWVKFRFLDQISKKPCQPDMLLDFILSMSIYSDSHCTKPDVGCS